MKQNRTKFFNAFKDRLNRSGKECKILEDTEEKLHETGIFDRFKIHQRTAVEYGSFKLGSNLLKDKVSYTLTEALSDTNFCRFSLRKGVSRCYFVRHSCFAASSQFHRLHGLTCPDLRSADLVQEAEMAGYLLVPHEKVPDSYNAGFSMYVNAWPLLSEYPGNRFQTGLFGTWMFAQLDQPEPKKMYSDIEGGLGWWRDTRFATKTPKFIMGGVALNFSEWANGPGAGKGRDWASPKGKYGIAQLSPRILWPPDGLNLKQGTCNQALRIRLPESSLDRIETDDGWASRADRRQLLDVVSQYRKLQRTRCLLHAVFLFACHDRRSFVGWTLSRQPSRQTQ